MTEAQVQRQKMFVRAYMGLALATGAILWPTMFIYMNTKQDLHLYIGIGLALLVSLIGTIFIIRKWGPQTASKAAASKDIVQ
jgi:hypothetical protein